VSHCYKCSQLTGGRCWRHSYLTGGGATNKVLRLNQIARRIDDLATRLRYQPQDPFVSESLWGLCAAHEEILRDLKAECGEIRARGTEERRPLPKKNDPLWKKGIGVVSAVLEYLDKG
jgi:hypothetical protein